MFREFKPCGVCGQRYPGTHSKHWNCQGRKDDETGIDRERGRGMALLECSPVGGHCGSRCGRAVSTDVEGSAAPGVVRLCGRRCDGGAAV